MFFYNIVKTSELEYFIKKKCFSQLRNSAATQKFLCSKTTVKPRPNFFLDQKWNRNKISVLKWKKLALVLQYFLNTEISEQQLSFSAVRNIFSYFSKKNLFPKKIMHELFVRFCFSFVGWPVFSVKTSFFFWKQWTPVTGVFVAFGERWKMLFHSGILLHPRIYFVLEVF